MQSSAARHSLPIGPIKSASDSKVLVTAHLLPVIIPKKFLDRVANLAASSSVSAAITFTQLHGVYLIDADGLKLFR
jgi:hypothetical protein